MSNEPSPSEFRELSVERWTELVGAWQVRAEAAESELAQARLELDDYAMLLREVPKVYEHVTGGRISKPNSRAEAVIAEADDYRQRELDPDTKDVVVSLPDVTHACFVCGHVHLPPATEFLGES